jgi:hypothetical protein
VNGSQETPSSVNAGGCGGGHGAGGNWPQASRASKEHGSMSAFSGGYRMGQPVTQHSFTGGEVAPEFRANTRNPRYSGSLRTCKNFLPIVHGALVNRAGTFDKGATKAADVRFEAFVFSNDQAFVLEFTAGAIRFWTAAGQVLNVGVPYEVATPYIVADLDFLKFAQAGDVVTITRSGYQPRDLTRITNTNWTLAVVSTTPDAYVNHGSVPRLSNPIPGGNIDPPAQWSSITNYAKGNVINRANIGYISLQAGNLNHPPDASGDTWWSPQSWDSTVTYRQGDMVWQTAGYDGTAATLPATANAQLYISLANNNLNHRPDTVSGFWVAAVDTSHPSQSWTILATVAWTDQLGVDRETMPTTVFADVRLPIFKDRAIGIFIPTIGLLPGTTAGKQYLFYAGRNGVFGYIGASDFNAGNAQTFTWDGTAPDFSQQPPKGTDPFAIAPAGSDSYPACVTFHDQRRVFAGSDVKPATFIGSATSDIARFDKYDTPQDGDAYEWKISSRKFEQVRSVESFGRLMLFSPQGVFTAHGADGKTISPNAVEVRRQNSFGASWLDPLPVDTVLLYNTARANKIRDLYFDFNANAYIGVDLTKYARHLFRGHTIVSWAHQAEPYQTVWVVRDDGVLLSLTYDRDTQTVAWAQHETNGIVKRVACIPNGTEDALFLAVQRNGAVRVEVMASRDYIPDVRLACFLDAALQYDGRNVGATTMTVSGASYDAEAVVTVAASVASFAAGDVDDEIVIDPNGTPTRIRVTEYTDTQHVFGRLLQPLPAGFQNIATALWGWGRDTLTGLGHLEGLQVTVLADGVVQGPFTVAGGQIGLLAPPALIATVGLSYTSDMELLDVATDGARTNVKSVSVVTFDVVASRGISAGETLDVVRPAKTRQVSDNFGAPALLTDKVAVTIKSDWNTGGRAALRQSDPLPLTVTAVTREVEFGGRGV